MSPENEKKETFSLQIRREINAPRERVFRAWTDPEELKMWHAPKEDFTIPIVELDVRVGGKYRIGMKPKDKEKPHIVGGVYKEINPPAKLVYTWIWEEEEMSVGETLVTIEFIDKGKSTEIIFTHELFPNSTRRDNHNQGWNGILDRLQKRFP